MLLSSILYYLTALMAALTPLPLHLALQRR